MGPAHYPISLLMASLWIKSGLSYSLKREIGVVVEVGQTHQVVVLFEALNERVFMALWDLPCIFLASKIWFMKIVITTLDNHILVRPSSPFFSAGRSPTFKICTYYKKGKFKLIDLCLLWRALILFRAYSRSWSRPKIIQQTFHFFAYVANIYALCKCVVVIGRMNCRKEDWMCEQCK